MGTASHLRHNHGDKADLVQVLARALRQIHALPIDECPFDRRYGALVARVSQQLESGLLTREMLAEEGWEGGPQEMLAWLDAHQPEREDLVFNLGDYCLPNVLVQDGVLPGFGDWGYAGVGDRYLDLAACAQSIARNLGAVWVAPFFAEYGVEQVDEEKLSLYRRIIVS